jgi:hypothetical protein
MLTKKVSNDFKKFTDIDCVGGIINGNIVISITSKLNCDNLFKIQQFIRVKFAEVDTDSYLEPKIYSHSNMLIIEFPISLINKLYHV